MDRTHAGAEVEVSAASQSVEVLLFGGWAVLLGRLGGAGMEHERSIGFLNLENRGDGEMGFWMECDGEAFAKGVFSVNLTGGGGGGNTMERTVYCR